MDEAWKAVKSGIYAVFRCRFGIYENVQCWDGKDKIFFSRPELRGKKHGRSPHDRGAGQASGGVSESLHNAGKEQRKYGLS